jgi:hypothetical protein
MYLVSNTLRRITRIDLGGLHCCPHAGSSLVTVLEQLVDET